MTPPTSSSSRALPTAALGLVLLLSAGVAAGQDQPVPGPGGQQNLPHVGLTLGKDRVQFLIDQKRFAEYIFKGLGTPVFYPIIGPNGTPMTRNYPMVEDAPGEEHDHPHHRSLWFGHKSVNGHDFWGRREGHGEVVHRRLNQMASGGQGSPATLVTENDWITNEGRGETICSDQREFRVTALAGGEALLDYIITIRADQGTPVEFGDEKDGLMAIRVAPWMRLEGKVAKGSIANSEGVTGNEAWGKRAKWVDYFGTDPSGEVIGVAVFDHPENLRHPTWWHARHYGLLAANPFGQGAFEGGKAKEGEKSGPGVFTIEAGGQLRLHYRFYFHRGDTQAAKVAERYAEFADK